MKLLRTTLMLETAERHIAGIDDSNLDKSAIASYLSRVAAVTFFSEMEERLQEVISTRVSGAGDERIAYFITTSHSKILRRAKRKEIADTVGLFGEDCKNHFREKITESDVIQYNNVIGDRHETAHGDGGDVTLSEVRVAVEIGERMLIAMAEVIA